MRSQRALALSAIAASLLYIPSSAWAACRDYGQDGTVFAGTASANGGSVCTLSHLSYSHVYVADVGSKLSTDNVTIQSSSNGVYVRAGGNFTSTGLVTINLNRANDDAFHVQDAGTTEVVRSH